MRTICKYKEICNSFGIKCNNCMNNRFDPKEDFFEPIPKEYEDLFK